MSKQHAGQTASSKPRYVEARVTIHHSRHDKGFAFGTAHIDGVATEVFVGSKANAKKDGNGLWQKTGTPMTPSEGDYLAAKICTDVDPGKQPYAAFWEIVLCASDNIDDGSEFDIFDDDDLGDVDETPCEFCTCWPCRCPREY